MSPDPSAAPDVARMRSSLWYMTAVTLCVSPCNSTKMLATTRCYSLIFRGSTQMHCLTVALCTYLPSACMFASWSGMCVLDGIHWPDITNVWGYHWKSKSHTGGKRVDDLGRDHSALYAIVYLKHRSVPEVEAEDLTSHRATLPSLDPDAKRSAATQVCVNSMAPATD